MENYQAMNAVVEKEKTFRELWEGISPQYALAYTYIGLILFAVLILLLSAVLIVVYKQFEDSRFFKHDLPGITLIGGALLILISAFIGIYFDYDISMALYFTGMVEYTVGCIFSFAAGTKYSRNTIIQGLIVAVFAFIWYLGALVSKDTDKNYSSIVVEGAITVSVNLIFFAYLFVKDVFAKRTMKQFLTEVKNYLWEKKFIVGIMILGTALSIEIITSTFLYDNSIYYRSFWDAVRWDFTTGNALNLHLCLHMCSGYSMLLLPGMWFFDDYTFGVHFFQLIYYVITVGAFYGIIEYIFPDKKQISKALMTAMFAFSPAFFGMLGGFNPDFGMTFLFVWFIYLLTKEDCLILQILIGLAAILTKEPAVLMFGGLFVACFIIFIMNRKSHPKVWDKAIALIFPIFYWCLDFFVPNMSILIMRVKDMLAYNPSFMGGRLVADAHKSWAAGTVYVTDSIDVLNAGNIDHFGYSKENIINQTKNLFCINFSWLFAILIIAGLIVCLILKIKQKKVFTQRAGNALLVSSVMILFMMPFFYFYITYTFYRYVAPLFSLVLIAFFVVADAVPVNRIAKFVSFGVLMLLLFVQNFVTIDPAMRFFGKEVSLGNISVYNFDSGLIDTTLSTPSDYTLYNRQNWYWGRLLNKAFTQMEAGEHSLLLVPKGEDRIVWGAYSCNQALDYQGLYFDEENKRYSPIQLSYSEPTTYAGITPDGICYDDNDQVIDISNFNHWYYLDIPFGCATDFDFKSAVYDAGLIIDGAQEIKCRGCKATLYTLSWDWDRLVIEDS